MKTKLICLIAYLLTFSAVGIFSQTVSVEPEPDKERALLYNLPNPFNETTTIKFLLKQDCYVKLSALNNESGSTIDLVDGILSAGEHGITFKAPANITSSYRCILTAYSETDNSVLYSSEIEMLHQAKP